MVRATASEMAAVKSTGQQAGAVGSSPYRSSVIAPPLPASRVQVHTGWSPCSFGYANADNATSVACDRRHCTALTCMARSFLLQGDGVADRSSGSAVVRRRLGRALRRLREDANIRIERP